MNATATTVTAAQTDSTVDLDTRLAITLAGMNVLLSQHLTDVSTCCAAGAEPVTIIEPAQGSNGILVKAAATLEAFGWHQGAYEDYPTGRLCALAAIDRVAVNGPARSAATRLLMDRIERIHGKRYRSIHAWNDDPDTIEQDVRDLLY